MNTLKINETRNAERGNTAVIVLVALVVLAVGGLFFVSQKNMDKAPKTDEVAAAETGKEGDAKTADATDAAPAAAGQEIKPGNPVVAKLNGKEIKRVDVFNYIQSMGQNIPQMPIGQLFPMALDQVINAEIIGKKVAKADLNGDASVKEQMKVAREQIERRVFIQKEIDKAMTEERLKAAYDEYVKNLPEVKERKTRHILVKEEAQAKELLGKIKAGEDFAAIAKEHSTDATKEKGGDLGYIAKDDQVIPEYIEAVYGMEVGEMSKKPMKSEFGYHIIEVQDERMRPAAPYEEAKPFLAQQLRGVVLNDLIAKWRASSDATVFDINGEPIEPAAGGAPATEKKDG